MIEASSLLPALKDYDEKGYAVVDNFLPLPVAEQLYNIFEKGTFEQIDQVRDHYKHVFATQAPTFPGPDEQYMARFGRSKPLEASEEVTSIFDRYFKPALKEMCRRPLAKYDIRCYRMAPGDFYRTHIDDYAGEIGGLYYFNKNWKWDWGGILGIGVEPDGENIVSVFPKFNRMMFLNHRKFRFPHFVSSITPYARVPRYTIVSFNS